jgi:hypothetical protein
MTAEMLCSLFGPRMVCASCGIIALREKSRQARRTRPKTLRPYLPALEPPQCGSLEVSSAHRSDKNVTRVTLKIFPETGARGGPRLPRAFVGRWPDPSLDHLGCG